MKKYVILAILVFTAINLTSIVFNFSAVCSEVPSSSIRLLELREPLFGIVYRPSEVHFENAPDFIYNCRGLERRRGSLFLFGKAAKGKSIFYYVYGWVVVDYDSTNKGIRHVEGEADEGIIVVVSPDGCNHIGAGYAWSNVKEQRQMAEKYGIADDVVSALIDDAVKREVRAFGGRAEFLRRFAASGIDESDLLPQARSKLTDLRKR